MYLNGLLQRIDLYKATTTRNNKGIHSIVSVNQSAIVAVIKMELINMDKDRLIIP